MQRLDARPSTPGEEVRQHEGSRQRGPRTRRLQREWLVRTVATLICVVGCLIVLAPLVSQVCTALKSSSEVYSGGLLPSHPHWSNFSDGWNAAPFNTYLLNTLIYAGGTIAGCLFSCTLAAYGFARIRFPGRRILFALTLVPLMLPGIATVVPQYVMFSKLGWINTFKPMIVPSFFGNAYYIFLLRQFLLTIPHELEDAARIDGCGWLRTFAMIIMPLAKPALAVIVIFQFQWAWNDFLTPLIYLTDSSKFTLAIGLYTFIQQYTADWTHLMAVSFLLMLPPAMLFFFAQRFMIQGVVTTGFAGR